MKRESVSTTLTCEMKNQDWLSDFFLNKRDLWRGKTCRNFNNVTSAEETKLEVDSLFAGARRLDEITLMELASTHST